MAGMKFEYDENGAKFFYFIVSFYAMVIIPSTYWFWPRKQVKKELHAEDLSCYEPCRLKNNLLNKNEPRKRFINNLTKLILIIGWIGFIILAYKTSQIEIEHKEYDPYAILGLDRETDEKVIKKKYRELSKTLHPDRGGNEEEFKELTKAYKALTDQEARENWAKYGNPDGPGVTQFGIALPKWIVEGKNSYLVLGVYLLLFMIIMPTIVGVWWYRSIKYTGDQLLMMTARIFYHFTIKTPEIIMKRAIMIISSSYEFDKASNSEIIERPNHNVDLPMLFKEFPEIQEKIKEQPFNFIHSVRARAFIYAHLARYPLDPNTLLLDKNVVIKKCPFLISEMISVISNISLQANNGPKGLHPPRLETLENFIRLSQMIVQALSDKNKKSSLLQLPHLEENHLRHFSNKKRNISTIKQFVTMKDSDRRSVLRHLTDEQYEDVMRVCKTYPLVTMEAHTNVFDDEDEHTITEGALVSMYVRLKRESLEVLFDNEDINEEQQQQQQQQDETDHLEATTEAEQKNMSKTPGSRSWNDKTKNKKNKNKKKEKTSSKTKMTSKQNQHDKATTDEKMSDSELDEDSDENEAEDDEEATNSQEFEKLDQADLDEEKTTSGLRKRKTTKKEKNDKSDKSSNVETIGTKEENNSSGEDFFEKFQKIQKKKEKLVTKSKVSHRVFCPYFPEIKQECWWIYVSEKKPAKIVSPVLSIYNLVDTEEVELKFLAPKKAGTYTYQVNLRSDSYLDFDIIQNIKINVQPAIQIEKHPQWDFTDDDMDKTNGEENDEFATESEEDD